MSKSQPTPVKSALRTLDVIEYIVARRGGAQAVEIAAALSIPMSSASYLLRTLCERNYLVRDDRIYLPGPGLDRLRLPATSLSLAERLQPLVRAVRNDLNETTSFMIRVGWMAETLLTEASDQSLRYAIAPGEQRPLHCLAAGKAILAELDDAELQQYFAATGREAFTLHTIVEETALRSQLLEARKRGFAQAREESVIGICSMAVAVKEEQKLVGTLSIAVPTVRFSNVLCERFQLLSRRLFLRPEQT
jgi:IclR family acetate operon transcriptional repressor